MCPPWLSQPVVLSNIEVCSTEAISCSLRLPLLKCGEGGVLPRVPQLGGHLQAVLLVSLCLAAFDDDVVDGAGQRDADVDGHLHRVLDLEMTDALPGVQEVVYENYDDYYSVV
jgi:hypothetical protein